MELFGLRAKVGLQAGPSATVLIKLIKLIKLFGLRAKVGLQARPAALFSWAGDSTDIGNPILVTHTGIGNPIPV
jgi:hypothetical protein